ncbi:MAG TPA: gluconate 2-dehydrogenase subunit 3 family protein [Steroidobacteraceae bacterium]|jgi:gluconate 2-dehydrogenase gamma chain|nr:gluconate 2-dehydrogenase subunit 3 family protein [Steroidobacteraceae bacterium]
MSPLRRRDLLKGTALVLAGGTAVRASIIAGRLPWQPGTASAPQPHAGNAPGGWNFFTAAEGAAIEAIADRLIPPDANTPGGKDAGCAAFIDRQLAGPYGQREGLYTVPPFEKGAKQQGPQSALNPAELYRKGLGALDDYVHAARDGHSFATLDAAQQDEILQGLEAGKIALGAGVDAQTFFEQLLQDVQQGFFADPIYGGNRDMCAWKMIGFPGARYDYRDWVGRHNEPYPLPPVSIAGRAEWTPKSG